MLESQDMINNRHGANLILQTTQNITGDSSLPRINPLEMNVIDFVGQRNNME